MRCLLPLLLLSAALPARAADDWTMFRGPNGSGVSKAKGLPITWDEKKDENIVWKTPIPGKGWSSPVVFGKQVWLTSAAADGTTRSAVCVDRDTGKILKDMKLFDTPKKLYVMIDFNSHASPSPVIEQGRVYVHFGSAGTACIDTKSFEVLWTRTDLKCDHWRGPGSSPVIWGDLLVLTFDGHDQQYVIALNKKNGETVWKRDRKIDWRLEKERDPGDLKKAYSTPAIVKVKDKELLVSPSAGGTIAYDKAGKEGWTLHHRGSMNASAPPLVGQGRVYVATAYKNLFFAVKPDGEGDVTDTHVDWKIQGSQVPSKPAPILVDDLIYFVSDAALATCVEAKTGKEVWKKRLGDKFTSSPVYADGHLYVCTQDDGRCYVLTTGREGGKVVATNQLGDPDKKSTDDGCMATPAIAGKALYVRTKRALYRIEKK
jgi:outer membrane protein assembly factor BamB